MIPYNQMAEAPPGFEWAADRRAHGQAALVDFLINEINLGFTYLETAGLATEPEHARSLLEQVRYGIAAARNFCGRVEDRKQWHAIHERLNQLEDALNSFPSEGNEADV